MLRTDVFERSPMRVFQRSIHGGLAVGELGAIVGQAGTGKSAFLVHLGLDRVLRDQRVLHVSLRDSADHVRSFYDEIVRMVSRAARLGPGEKLGLQVERNRMIHAYLDRPFGAADLGQALDMLRTVMQFEGTTVLVDAADGTAGEELDAFRALAQERGLAIWFGLRTGTEGDPGRFDTVIQLDPRDDVIDLHALRVHGVEQSAPIGLELDPVTLLVRGEDTWDPASAPFTPMAEACTLYSGGAPGAEATFGEAAERYGVKEVNFTFDGHKAARTANGYELSPRELAAGDVSLLYVSRRLNREYSERGLIRKVLQSLWHQVSRAQEVYVVGVIQEDGTVVGGTGWSVELARMWHKTLWVYDQERKAWYQWNGSAWTQGTPVIQAPHFCGTGTRFLTEDGNDAIYGLFARSFGA